MGRVMAIDYGQKRVGFAVTDELQICAHALETVPVAQAFDYLKDYGFTFYIVSGSDRFIARALVSDIGIDPRFVIGMDVTVVVGGGDIGAEE